jgi:formylglycine-generating enzyme required for sulfatase activity
MSEFDPYHQWLGIPVTERPISKYRLLGLVDFEVDRDVISAAAERQTIYLRTLQSGEHAVLVAELLNEVSQARVTLLNTDQKAEYDEELRKQQTPESVPDPTPIPVVQTPTPLQNIPPPTPAGDWEPVAQNRPQALAAEWATFQTAKRPRRKVQQGIWKRPAVIGVSVVGGIGVFVLLISLMSSGDAEPVASNTAGRISAEKAVKNTAAETTAAEKADAEKADAEKADAEKAAAVTAALDKGDWKAVLSLYPNNSEGLRMKAAADKAVLEKAAMEKAAMDKAAAITAALAKGDWKAVLALDADNSDGLRMQAVTEEKAAILARVPIINTIRMKLKLIPSGNFIMGSPETEMERQPSETQHKVTISKAFYMQTTEVTQAQWKAVMGTEPWKGENWVKEGPNYAASYLSWDDAVAYCKALSKIEGKTYRLPTETEWEYACRAGTQTTWSFGNDEDALGDYAWYYKNAMSIGGEYAHLVGQKKPNAFGLYDMHGNVFEWCHDTQGGIVTNRWRVLRGGSWYYFMSDTSSAMRKRHDADYGGPSTGFRLVRELD